MADLPAIDKIFSALHIDSPFPWQSDLASGSAPSNRLIRIPTGMGKTLGVLTTWLQHRVIEENTQWPTRLVWCLPMRTLVEQTESEAKKLLDALGLTDEVRVHLLMGGAESSRWYCDPAQPAILVGTQDMLLSGALNRAYGTGRAAWPRVFGLLNSDALWVMDEVQLMGVGLATSAQIQSFWEKSPAGSAELCSKPRCTWWMSATLQPQWLESPDTTAMVEECRSSVLKVTPSDRVGSVWEAQKPMERLSLDVEDWAEVIQKTHSSHTADPKTGRQTLVVVNTVKRAVEVHTQLQRLLSGALTSSADSSPELHLVHSRFRPADREGWVGSFLSRESLGPDVDRILVATQVVEAGVDISASCLMTELAPWPSLVQRFGRAARYGGTALVNVLDPEFEDDKKAAPYSVEELRAARQALGQVSDVSIRCLEEFEDGLSLKSTEELYPYQPLHVLMQDELYELFDTSSDLSGSDMDISRFIRGEEEARDVQVCWRDWIGDQPDKELTPHRRELCNVPIVLAKAWVQKVKKRSESVYSWEYLEGEWTKADDSRLRPGMLLVVRPSSGGYDPKVGFTGDKPKKNALVPEVMPVDSSVLPKHLQTSLSDRSESNELGSALPVWKTIATHSREAGQMARTVSKDLQIPDRMGALLEQTLRLHDWGKAHPAFAEGTYRVTPPRQDLAKAPDAAWRARNQLYKTDTHGHRRGFRHELASCLAVLELLRITRPDHGALLGSCEAILRAAGIEPNWPDSGGESSPLGAEVAALSPDEVNLLLYLIASHHGKVRASLNASPKDQEFPFEDDSLVGTGIPIRGVREGDTMPSIALPLAGGDTQTPALTLHLSVAAMGLSPEYGASWSERVQSLLSRFGPFALGYLEAVVRAVDGAASDDSRPPGSDPDPLLLGQALQVGSPELDPEVTRA